MKKTILVLGVVILLFSACSVLSPTLPTSTPIPTPTPLPLPTPTPDPCSKENILTEFENLKLSVNEFKEVEVIANQIDVNSMVLLILRLQEIRYQVMREKVPACLETFKSASINYTGSVMNYLLIFMNNPKSEDLKTAIQTSQTQWQILLNEFNKILAIAGVEAQAVPTPAVTAVTATNEGSEAVVVRAKPTSNAEVVTSIEKGKQAEVIGRNETSDWLNIKVNDITGWVFAELVATSVPVDQLPVVEVTP